MQNISSLEDSHKGQDAYVIGGGKSLDYYPEGFFEGRFVLAVNQASRIVPANYVIRKESVAHGFVPVIASRYIAGMIDMAENEADYIFEHRHNTLGQIDTMGCHPRGNKIIVSWSTITSAIHLSAFMGARTVFLAGHDCATLDGEQVAKGYYEGVNRITAEQAYSNWLAKIAPQTAFVRDYLMEEYQVPVISLSPFIGLTHEGHEVA